HHSGRKANDCRSARLAGPRHPEQHDRDRQLVNAIRATETDACERLAHLYGGRMLAVARRFLRCDADAADAVQDAFASALRNINTFEGRSSLATWLHRIVVNACLAKRRS